MIVFKNVCFCPKITEVLLLKQFSLLFGNKLFGIDLYVKRDIVLRDRELGLEGARGLP